jgi:hypothetical protein
VAELREDLLHRRWYHAYEEDSDGEMVFRPEGHPLPPARGRTSIELRADGSYVESAPGPVDVPVESSGSWSLDGDRLTLGGTADQPGHEWRVMAASADRLTVRP